MSLSTALWNHSSPIDHTSPTLPTRSTPSSTATSSPVSPRSSATFYSSTQHQLHSYQAQVLPDDLSGMTVAHAAMTTTGPTEVRKRRSISSKLLELNEQDDWTKVKDPKEKKRIQNRVAQRTYRNRMKARLGELQARLDSHEKRLFYQTISGTKDDTTSVYETASQNPAAPVAGPSLEECSSPVTQQIKNEAPGTRRRKRGPAQESPELLSSPSSSLSSSPQTHSLLSPSGHSIHERDTTLSEDFVFSCMDFQSQLLNRLSSQQNSSYDVSYMGADGISSVLGDMSPVEQTSCLCDFTSPEGMDFGFNGDVDIWRAGALANKAPPSPISRDTLDVQTLSTSGSTVSMEAGMMDFDGLISRGSYAVAACERETLDRRLERIAKVAEMEGFDSLDALVEAYYCHKFDERSPLASEQRLSRQRRLPKMINSVFQASRQWSEWERRGLEEETLKTAETMLSMESAKARGPLMKAMSLMKADESSGSHSAAHSSMLLHGMKQSRTR